MGYFQNLHLNTFVNIMYILHHLLSAMKLSSSYSSSSVLFSIRFLLTVAFLFCFALAAASRSPSPVYLLPPSPEDEPLQITIPLKKSKPKQSSPTDSQWTVARTNP